MPELPEVEVTRLSFAERIAARASTRCAWASRCAGRSASRPSSCVGQTRRRGRAARQVPVAAARARRPADAPGHVGLAGLRRRGAGARPARPLRPGHQPGHAAPDRPAPLRRGGLVAVGADAAPAAKLLAGLGLEPFDPALRRRRTCTRRCASASVAVKQALLGGDDRRRRGQHLRLRGAVRGRHRSAHAQRPPQPAARRAPAPPRCAHVLARAVELGGSTLRDFRDAHGAAGEFQLEARVYGRAGEPCRALRRHRPAHRAGRRGRRISAPAASAADGRRSGVRRHARSRASVRNVRAAS